MTPAELRERRRRSGLTQAALAERLGVRPRQVIRWEHGTSPIRTMTEMALESIFSQPSSRTCPRCGPCECEDCQSGYCGDVERSVIR